MTLREVERDAVQMGRRWLNDLLFADWGLKLLALAITLGLWFAVTGQRVLTTARLHNVPLFLVLPVDMESSNEPRDEVDLTLRGSKRALDAIKAGGVSLSYDASSYKPGERVVQLSPNNITLQLPESVSPENVTIERIEPGSVPLRLERRIERELEVPALKANCRKASSDGTQSLPVRSCAALEPSTRRTRAHRTTCSKAG